MEAFEANDGGKEVGKECGEAKTTRRQAVAAKGKKYEEMMKN